MDQTKLRLYMMNMKYVRDLHRADDRVQSVSPQIHKSSRPFVGVVVVCENHKYCIPLDHPKEKHYNMKNDIDFMRIFDGNKLIGVLNFNNMIPVHESLISILDVKVKNKDSADERRMTGQCVLPYVMMKKGYAPFLKRKSGKSVRMRRCLTGRRFMEILYNNNPAI